MNEQLRNRNIIETLRAIDQTDDKDIAFIFAASINLYIESIRRLRGRVMLGPDDIPIILDIISDLTKKTPAESKFRDDALRTRELTTEERSNLLNVRVNDEEAQAQQIPSPPRQEGTESQIPRR